MYSMRASGTPAQILDPSPLSTAQGRDFESLDAGRLADVCRAWLQCNPDVVILLTPDKKIAHISRAPGCRRLACCTSVVHKY